MALLGAVAFVNALASVIVFPLAPFLVADLAVPAQQAALASVIFTAAASLGGLGAAFWLGGADRWRLMGGALAGLGLASLAGGLAPDFTWLLLSRALAGLCAGPLLATVFAIIPDAVPAERRNRALSLVVGAYGLALVLGLPSALLLATAGGGWRSAFLGMGLLCLALTAPGYLAAQPAVAGVLAIRPQGVWRLVRRGESLTGLALIASASFGTLLIAPHIGTFALRNAGLGETALWAVYLTGGGLALVTTRATGWAMDRLGPLVASIAVGAGLSVLLLVVFVLPEPGLPVSPLLSLILAAQLARSTVAQASAAQVACPADRLTYQCLVVAGTSLAQAAGAACSVLLLCEAADGRLVGMGWLAAGSIAMAWTAPFLLLLLKVQLRRRGELMIFSPFNESVH